MRVMIRDVVLDAGLSYDSQSRNHCFSVFSDGGACFSSFLMVLNGCGRPASMVSPTFSYDFSMLEHGSLGLQPFLNGGACLSFVRVGRACFGKGFQLFSKTPYQWKQLKNRGNTAHYRSTIENTGKQCPPLQFKWKPKGKL